MDTIPRHSEVDPTNLGHLLIHQWVLLQIGEASLPPPSRAMGAIYPMNLVVIAWMYRRPMLLQVLNYIYVRPPFEWVEKLNTLHVPGLIWTLELISALLAPNDQSVPISKNALVERSHTISEAAYKFVHELELAISGGYSEELSGGGHKVRWPTDPLTERSDI